MRIIRDAAPYEIILARRQRLGNLDNEGPGRLGRIESELDDLTFDGSAFGTDTGDGVKFHAGQIYLIVEIQYESLRRGDEVAVRRYGRGYFRMRKSHA